MKRSSIPKVISFVEVKVIEGKECEVPKKGYMRELTRGSDVDQLITLQDTVLKTLESPYYLTECKREEIEYLVENGRYVGVFLSEGDYLIGAYCMSYTFPSNRKCYWEIVNYPEPQRCVGAVVTMIDPKFRKNGLYPLMKNHQWDYFAKVEKKDQIFFTIYPLNPTTLPWVLKFSRSIILGLKFDFYGEGQHRYIFHCDYHHQGVERRFSEEKKLELTDFEEQKKLLEEDYVGFALKNEDGKKFMIFGKEVRDKE